MRTQDSRGARVYSVQASTGWSLSSMSAAPRSPRRDRARRIHEVEQVVGAAGAQDRGRAVLPVVHDLDRLRVDDGLDVQHRLDLDEVVGARLRDQLQVDHVSAEGADAVHVALGDVLHDEARDRVLDQPVADPPVRERSADQLGRIRDADGRAPSRGGTGTPARPRGTGGGGGVHHDRVHVLEREARRHGGREDLRHPRHGDGDTVQRHAARRVEGETRRDAHLDEDVEVPDHVARGEDLGPLGTQAGASAIRRSEHTKKANAGRRGTDEPSGGVGTLHSIRMAHPWQSCCARVKPLTGSQRLRTG